jgi:Helix-turn-helix domain
MAAARKTKETASSGNETKSGNKTDSDARSRNATEAAGDQTDLDGDTWLPTTINTDGDDAWPPATINADNGGFEPPATIDADSGGSEPPATTDAESEHSEPPEEISTYSGGPAPSSPSAEPSRAGAESEPSLGRSLAAARERHGLSRADIVAETRIPAHYIEMIESSDYGLISDQLYLMPFLRRYAAFLNLDGEEVAMRFVREVQRAELAAVAAPRMSEPIALRDHKRAPWGRVAMVVIVLSAIVVLYLIASEHHSGEFGVHQASPPAEPTEPSATIPQIVAPPPMVAPAPIVAPPPMAAPAPRAAAPAQLPRTTVVGRPKAPAATRLRKAAPSRPIAPSDSHNE